MNIAEVSKTFGLSADTLQARADALSRRLDRRLKELDAERDIATNPDIF